MNTFLKYNDIYALLLFCDIKTRENDTISKAKKNKKKKNRENSK